VSLSADKTDVATAESHSMDGVPMASAREFVHGDPFTVNLLALAQRVAKTDVTVLIGGPSGTGKEVLARLIHQHSQRSQGAFIAFNTACLPDSMVEDMLFGHEKGSFTGAIAKFDGYFAQADGGTLFLDEIGELPLIIQAKLLRVLQEREYTPLGSTRPRHTNFRLITASNRSLNQEVKAGRFREDLFYRLNIFPLNIKPLCERPGDIVPLAAAMLKRYAKIRGLVDLTPNAVKELMSYRWPGNVRELENVIQRALVISDGACIDSEHLGLEETSQIVTNAAPEAEAIDDGSATAEPLANARLQHEAQVITQTLKNSQSRVAAAAKLGISERTLRYKLARLRAEGFQIDEPNVEVA
jgi:two-component system, response regulator FlrC